MTQPTLEDLGTHLSQATFCVVDLETTGGGTESRITEFGAEIVDNSPEELLEAVREMEARLAGTWTESPQDAALQQAFWERYRPHYPDRVYVARIGADFLRQNPHWTR